MIEGTLVNLRPQEVSDAEWNARWWASADCKWFMGRRYDSSLSAAIEETREAAVPAAGSRDVWLAIETKDGVHIGNCGLSEVSPEDRRAKLSLSLAEPERRSKGFGTDVVRTLVRFGFEEMNLHRIELDVFEYNERAIACYRKCGFVEEARLRQARYARGVHHDTIVMALLRDQWREAR